MLIGKRLNFIAWLLSICGLWDWSNTRKRRWLSCRHGQHTLCHQGELENAALAVTDALPLVSRRSDLAVVRNLLAEIRYYQARYQEMQQLTVLVMEAQAVVDTSVFVQTLVLNGLAACGRAQLGEAVVQFQRARELCQPLANESLFSFVLAGMAMLCRHQLQLEAGEQMLQQAIQQIDPTRPTRLAFVWIMLSRVQLMSGQAERALKTIDKGMDQIRNMSRNWLTRMLVRRATIFLYLGRAMAAERD